MIDINENAFNDIPYFVVEDTSVALKAEVLLYHGWGSDAKKQCFRARLLAAFGYRVFVPEIIHHGTRGTALYEDTVSAPLFFEVLEESVKEGCYLLENIMVDEMLHFIIGHSLGGMIALGLAGEPSVQGVVAMNSSAKWSEPIELLNGVYKEDTEKFLKVDEAKREKPSFSPENWSVNHISTPVLLTNGALDNTMPLQMNEEFLKRCTNPNAKQLIFPETGHVVTDGMLREAIAFMEKWSRNY